MADLADYSTNTRFLLACCAPGAAPARIAPDWTWLAGAAARHGVTPLVARHAAAAAPGDDAPARQRIVTQGQALRLRNQYLTARLAELLDELRCAGLPALALKGPVLAALAYGDVGMRAFADLDLLVQPADRAATMGLLARRGLSAGLYDEAAVASGFFDVVETNCQSHDGIVNLDLHWDLAPAYYRCGPGGAAVWARARAVRVEGGAMRTLGPEDHLLFLAVHAARHGWPVLSQVADIAHLVARVALDWPVALARAAATRCLRMLATGLLLAHELLAAPLPDAVLAAGRADHQAVALARSIAAGFNRDAPPTATDLVRRSWASLAGPRERLRYVAGHGFTPTLLDWRYWPLPRPLYPVYYVVRPFRLGRNLGARWRGARPARVA